MGQGVNFYFKNYISLGASVFWLEAISTLFLPYKTRMVQNPWAFTHQDS